MTTIALSGVPCASRTLSRTDAATGATTGSTNLQSIQQIQRPRNRNPLHTTAMSLRPTHRQIHREEQ